MIKAERNTVQDTGFGGAIVTVVMLFVFVLGIAILLSIAFVCDVFKNIFPR
tara:strand:+ start:866 stop:1018 length:153 start_codon:yes stop_codon:yes gene_type:complete